MAKTIPLNFILHRVNRPDVISYTIEKYGMDCEVDVWGINDELFLGHDGPEYRVSYEFLDNHKDHLWLHAKNFTALSRLQHLNVFFHKDDDFTLTSKGYIWKYPEVYKGSNLVAICSDVALELKEEYNGNV